MVLYVSKNIISHSLFLHLASLDVGRPLEFLHKKSYDNMADYMSKKEQRVAEELVRKEKYEARQSRQAQRKRMKLEEEGARS